MFINHTIVFESIEKKKIVDDIKHLRSYDGWCFNNRKNDAMRSMFKNSFSPSIVHQHNDSKVKITNYSN
jgi:hypothetical protein